MISQSDIIRTLVNKNCTDESILAIALSPNCNPAKLLAKSAEAERFDLAIDISTKLGLSTAPLWRTWAIRCLKHRKFQAARDKFKLCFQRLKPQSSRSNISLASSDLLGEIVRLLAGLDENCITLNDEIKAIKSQQLTGAIDEITADDTILESKSILDKPTIYNECMYYLKEYGNVKDHIKFYVRHSLWDLLIRNVIDNRATLSDGKFFITDVFLKTASTGRLEDLISGFLKHDKNLESSRQIFQSIYDHCTNERLYNLLDYIQYRIGDHVGAAESQINHHFLREPVRNYKELNHRLPSLMKSLEHYQEYSKKLSDKKHRISMKNDLKRKDVIKNELFSEMSFINVQKRISTIELQIEITKNFALNDISGCVSDIEPTDVEHNKVMGNRTDRPVTLFDRNERRITFLTALVLIYFDPECSSYFASKGFELARHLMRKLQLNKIDVFKLAMRIIIEDESCDIHESTQLLLNRLKQDYDDDVSIITKQLPMQRLTLKPFNKPSQPKSLTARTSTQESEKVSLFSNSSILSSTTTTSSSSASSSSPPLSIGVDLGNPKLRSSIDHKISKTGSTSSSSKLVMPQRPDQHRKSLLSPASASSTARVIVRNNSASKLSTSSLSSTATITTTTTAASATPTNIILFDDVKTKQVVSNRLSAITRPTNSATMASVAATASSPSLSVGMMGRSSSPLQAKGVTSLSAFDTAQDLCDDVIRDAIKCCREADYKMDLAKLLSPKAKIELYIELGKLSNAQRLAFSMDWPDYVAKIIEEAERLNQNHVKIVCQHWLAKHESHASLASQQQQQL